jgi:hypothetical protein
MRRLLYLAIVGLGGTVACERAPVAPSVLSQPAVLSVLAEAPVSGAIVDVTAGSTGTTNHPGQSVTIPAGTYGNLHFNWYSRDGAPVAFGTLYVLTQEYLGVPGGLAVAQGLVAASSQVANGEYMFPEALAITGGRRYWFYGDTMGNYCTSFDIDTYSGGDSYNTGYFANPFSKTHASGRYTSFNPPVFVPAPAGLYVDANFRLRGSLIEK